MINNKNQGKGLKDAQQQDDWNGKQTDKNRDTSMNNDQRDSSRKNDKTAHGRKDRDKK